MFSWFKRGSTWIMLGGSVAIGIMIGLMQVWSLSGTMILLLSSTLNYLLGGIVMYRRMHEKGRLRDR